MDHEGMPDRRRMGVYEEYTNRVKSSADVRDLTRFISRLASKVGSVPVLDDAAKAALALDEADPQPVLDALRQDTAAIIGRMRANQEAKREAHKAAQAERAKADKEAAKAQRHQEWLDEQASSGLPL